MAYDTNLAARVRRAAGALRGVTEKQMFGGLAFLLDGKMFVGVLGDELMVRVGPARHEEALWHPHVRAMDFTGRPMRGYVFVAAAGLAEDAAVERWVAWSSGFVAGLPARGGPAGAVPAGSRGARASAGARGRATSGARGKRKSARRHAAR